MVAQIAQMEQEATQCKERIEGLVLTQEKLEKSLNDQILARLEEETKRKDLERSDSQHTHTHTRARERPQDYVTQWLCWRDVFYHNKSPSQGSGLIDISEGGS